jgi:pectate lyase
VFPVRYDLSVTYHAVYFQACKSKHPKVRDLQMTFQEPHIYDYITKLCRKQAEVIQNHENSETIRGLNLAAVKRTTVQVTKLPL